MRNPAEYLRLAYEVAGRSPDPSTQTGAVLVGRCGSEVLAYNSIPMPLETTQERLHDRELKSQYLEHAERRAIYSAARRGICTKGATLYSPWPPCTGCARAVVDSGIGELVFHRLLLQLTPDRWIDEIRAGMQILIAGSVKLTPFKSPLNASPIRFDGNIVHP